jgi:hypothetical protein
MFFGMTNFEDRSCTGCGHSGPGWQFEEHHPDRVARPKFTVTLCIPCHREVTRRERSPAGTQSARFELRCRADQLERWQAAAGDVPLSRWIRNVCNEVAAGIPVVSDPGVPSGTVEVRDGGKTVGVITGVARTSFKPDFGSRLKEK